jgi:glucokinase
MLLVGDVGGTKTLLGLYTAARGPRVSLFEAVFRSADYPDLESLIHDFLGKVHRALEGEGPVRVQRAFLAVAGPVIGGRARITNLPWLIDETQLARELQCLSVRLLNDLEAIAWSVPHLKDEELATLSTGTEQPYGALAVVAPGTGLGEAFLTWDGTRYVSHGSEGGHADFAPNSGEERELLAFLEPRFGHVSYERVCSGIGVPNLYAFHKEVGRLEEPAWLAERLAAAADPTPIIVQAALDESRPCPICRATLETFVSVLGACAGNLALTVLSTGGVYLGGGIPPRILPLLRSERFLAAFRAKGRMSELLARMPVHVILDPKSALLGMSSYGLGLLT